MLVPLKVERRLFVQFANTSIVHSSGVFVVVPAVVVDRIRVSRGLTERKIT